MKTDKEYPATHSMQTAWYCADEDGNVGIFDIADNGPVPVGGYQDSYLPDVIWEDFSKDEGKYRLMNLTNEQLTRLIGPENIKPVGEEYAIGEDIMYRLHNKVVRVDMDRLDFFLERASSEGYYTPVCISWEHGLFLIRSFIKEEDAKLLLQEKVIKAVGDTVFCDLLDHYDPDEESVLIQVRRLPMFIYKQDYNPDMRPALRLSNPEHPMKVNQLPEEVRKNITVLPVKFYEHEKIQLAELLPVYGIGSSKIIYNNESWWELAASDGSTIYYCVSTNEILSENEMDNLIESGLAKKGR